MDDALILYLQQFEGISGFLKSASIEVEFLTERWNSHLILDSQVELLDARKWTQSQLHSFLVGASDVESDWR